jgi:hypothetical protein
MLKILSIIIALPRASPITILDAKTPIRYPKTLQ